MGDRQRAVDAMREWDWVRVELSTTIAPPPATTWIAEGRLWLSGRSLMLGTDFIRHSNYAVSTGVVRVLEHRPMDMEERISRVRAEAAGQEYVAKEQAATQEWMDKTRAEHWCNSSTPNGETVSRPCTCSIGKHHEDNGNTYELGTTEEG